MVIDSVKLRARIIAPTFSMSKQRYQQASFAISAAKLSQLPKDEGAEIAFVGRSNAGKSSALNAIAQQKSLAKTSKTPGRTQLINVFDLDEHNRLIDLPGYGYAKVPDKVKQNWQQLLSKYLETRDSLRGLILLMDIRHPLKDTDKMLIEWAHQSELPTHILLTKCDKLTYGAAKKTLLEVSRDLKHYGDLITLQMFSAKDRTGLDDLYEQLDSWLINE